MRKLIVFNQVSIDGRFVDAKGDMSWAHKDDAEWNDYVNGNASGGGVLVFGRITYEMMAGYWPSPMAAKNNPVVAQQMNRLPKIVFSRTLENTSWQNTTLLHGDPSDEMRRLKKEDGGDMVVMGSGTIVSQLTEHGLVDQYQIVVVPVILGGGRTMFDGVTRRPSLRLMQTRSFSNGNVVMHYERA
jgi:dihydrofolate reductase